MREIKFRGKSNCNLGWIVGQLLIEKNDLLIISSPVEWIDNMEFKISDYHSFYPETLGQFTGLKDKKGVEIFEGDVLRSEHGKHYWEYVVSVDPYNPSSLLYAVETFNNVTKDIDEDLYTYERTDSRNGMKSDVATISKSAVVIGNVHDSPELLQ